MILGKVINAKILNQSRDKKKKIIAMSGVSIEFSN